MNMFKKSKAKTIAAYMASLPTERQEEMRFLHGFIRKAVPSLKPRFAYNMPGYGSFKYRNHKRQILDWPIIALASQKHYISIYVCALEDGKYIAEKHAKELGKVNVGRSCIRFRKVEDVDLKALKKVLQAAARSPGLVGAEKP